ncbi:ribitol-5-phosphate cytidylyltransferase 2 [Lachnospiraceae bacterium]|nr:ribitol-5-phosphate cytidylyltransferase 2 [Lachnospiraceae bacterium]
MVIAGIVAGGVGMRMGQNIRPKQFIDLMGKPIIIHTIEKFMVSPDIDYIIVGTHPDWLSLMYDLAYKYFIDTDKIFIISGGVNRNETIKNIAIAAREKCKAGDDAILVTHDAVRPFLSLRIIHENVQAVMKYGVCDTVAEATDTIVRSGDQEFITDIPVRREMYQGQTPQSFNIKLFEDVYNGMTEEELNIVTDACKLFYLRNYKVKLVKGDVANFKITYPFDLKMAQLMVGDLVDD